MKIFIKILIFCTLYNYGYSQNDIFIDLDVNKYFFSDKQDTLLVSVKINSEFINSNLHSEDSEFYLKLESFSESINEEEKFEIIKFFKFVDSINEFNEYEAKVPISDLEAKRYIPDIILKGEKNIYKLSDQSLKINPISIGDFGIYLSDIEININGIKSKFELMGDNKSNSLPVQFEGIFTKGFCSDEFLQVSGIKIANWAKNSDSEFKIILNYDIDGKQYPAKEIEYAIDDSKDGILEFNDMKFDYNFYSDSLITDYCINYNQLTDNILKLISNNGSNDHSFNLYFDVFLEENYRRYPSHGYFSFIFRVVDDPVGPDCQASLLPIDLLEWQVYKKEKTVYLNWETANEINNDFFDIERSSDASNWQSIKRISGNGTSNLHTEYHETDNFPFLGINYYRLKQTDYNGENKYSRVRSITNIENSLIFWPNPVTDYLHYEVMDEKRQFSIELFDASGRIVGSYIVPDKFNIQNNLDLSNLESGIYVFKYINLSNNQFQITKLIKL